MNQESKDRREYFRIKYLLSERRYVNINGKNFRVLDLSCEGVKLHCKDVSEFEIGQMIGGEISFKDGATLYLFGKNIRVEDDEMAVRLLKPIPEEKIVHEEGYLINNCIHRNTGGSKR